MLWPGVDIIARRDTENPSLNVLIIYSKSISVPFIWLFSTNIPIVSASFASLYRDEIFVQAVETNAYDTRQSDEKASVFLTYTDKK